MCSDRALCLIMHCARSTMLATWACLCVTSSAIVSLIHAADMSNISLPRRCSAAESESDILLEAPVPFYIEASDVHVDIGPDRLQVSIRNTLSFKRTYWKHRWALPVAWLSYCMLLFIWQFPIGLLVTI